MPIYAHNAGAVYSLKYHLVFCPKYRRPVLVDAVAERLKVLLAERAACYDLVAAADPAALVPLEREARWCGRAVVRDGRFELLGSAA